MDENEVKLKDTIERLIAGFEKPRKHSDIIDGCIGLERVTRHTHAPTDKLELCTAKGLLVFGMDSDSNEMTIYHIHPTYNYSHKKDVIKPVINLFTKSILVISNTTGKGVSKLWKINIKR